MLPCGGRATRDAVFLTRSSLGTCCARWSFRATGSWEWEFGYNDRSRRLGEVSMPRDQLHRGDDAEPAPSSALDLLKSVAAVAGVLTGLAFINGWLYWATYYTAFGLNSLVLDLPFSVVSVSLVQVFVRDWKTESGLVKVVLALGIVAVIALTALFVRWYNHRHAAAILLPVLLVL